MGRHTRRSPGWQWRPSGQFGLVRSRSPWSRRYRWCDSIVNLAVSPSPRFTHPSLLAKSKSRSGLGGGSRTPVYDLYGIITATATTTTELTVQPATTQMGGREAPSSSARDSQPCPWATSSKGPLSHRRDRDCDPEKACAAAKAGFNTLHPRSGRSTHVPRSVIDSVHAKDHVHGASRHQTWR